MSTAAHKLMTVDEFLAWAEGWEGRWELFDGRPIATDNSKGIGFPSEASSAIVPSMSTAAEKLMTVDEFLGWAEGREGRWELYDGRPIAMSPERVAHLVTKATAFLALTRALDRAGASCHVLPDGATVRVDPHTAFEPDALVYCGERLPPRAIEVPSPVIVVEVLSEGTAARDHGVKLAGYFSLPSVAHYLILDPDSRIAIHHRRGQGDVIETRILTSGSLRLDPPGLEFAVAELFPPAETPLPTGEGPAHPGAADRGL
jgi:Uma2 family endonuclease